MGMDREHVLIVRPELHQPRYTDHSEMLPQLYSRIFRGEIGRFRRVRPSGTKNDLCCLWARRAQLVPFCHCKRFSVGSGWYRETPQHPGKIPLVYIESNNQMSANRIDPPSMSALRLCAHRPDWVLATVLNRQSDKPDRNSSFNPNRRRWTVTSDGPTHCPRSS
jgi:hypothetical protein